MEFQAVIGLIGKMTEAKLVYWQLVFMAFDPKLRNITEQRK